jgi:hypothetical protein
MAQQAAVYNYYGTGGENVLDPPELPEAPEDGWEVELDTGPFGESCNGHLSTFRLVRLDHGG